MFYLFIYYFHLFSFKVIKITYILKCQMIKVMNNLLSILKVLN